VNSHGANEVATVLLRYRYAASQPFKNRELLRSFLSLPLRGYLFDEEWEIHTYSNNGPK
jgi:hypothetical protein